MLFFVILPLFFLKVTNVFAVTCTQNGSTAYCTNSSGQTTTYNQYGNNIYGSDGSSYTMYGNTTYGSGNVFNSGGSSNSGSSSVSVGGADLNSPEMIAARAKYDAACASTSSEPMSGGTQASNCREATTEWLRAVSESQRNNSATSSTEDTDYESETSASEDESLDEFMTKILSTFNISTNTKPGNSCVSRGFPNSHPEGNNCFCDIGYLQISNKCVPQTIENCELLTGGPGAIPLEGTNLCRCAAGYSTNSSKTTCIPTSNTANNKAVNSPSVQPINAKTKNVPLIKETPIPTSMLVDTALSSATTNIANNFDTPTSPTLPETSLPKKSLWQKFLSWIKWR